MKKITIIAILLSLSVNLLAQYGDVDSLEILLATEYNDTSRVNILNKLSKKLSYTNPDKAYKFANQSIEICNKANYKKGLAFAYQQLAFIYFYKGHTNESLESFEKSLLTYQALKDKLNVAKIHNNIGIVYKTSGEYKLSLEHYTSSINILKNLKDNDILSETYYNIASILILQTNYSKALEYSFDALKIINNNDEKDKNTIITKANIKFDIGVIYHHQKEYNNAQNYYLKAAELFKSIEHKNDVAKTYFNIGVLKFEQKNYNEAIIYYNKSLNYYTEKTDIAYTNYSIGNIINKQGDYEKSIPFFEKSLGLYNNINNQSGVALCLSGIGEYYYKTEKYEKAVTILDSAYQIANSIGDVLLIKNICEYLSYAYSKTNNFELAYSTHCVYKKMYDSINIIENKRHKVELEMQYKFKKEQHNQKINNQTEKNNLQIIIVISLMAVILFIVLSFFTYRSSKIKKRANMALIQKNAEINQQNEEIRTQKDAIEKHKNDIEKQHKLVLIKNQEIGNSILYAKRIQQAVMSNFSILKNHFSEYLIYFKPRDVVSGDFYWVGEKNNCSIVIAADCTGHGVPAAFMSMLGISFLNEIINKNEEFQANIILDKLRSAIIKSLNQDKSDDLLINEGIDVAIAIINSKTKILQYAGAYNPLYLIRNKQMDVPKLSKNQFKITEYINSENHLIELKADRMPVGLYINDLKPFTAKEIKIMVGDSIYLFSDGYTDQFGGITEKKYSVRRFKKLLLKNVSKPMNEQSKILKTTHKEWRADIKQLDDILVIGLKI